MNNIMKNLFKREFLSGIVILFWIIQLLSQSPDTQWTNTYGGLNEEYGYSVQKTSDGGFIIAGWTYSFGEGSPAYSNFYIVRTDSSGDSLWTKTIGGANYDFAFSVVSVQDSEYVIVGETQSFGVGASDIYVVKLGPPLSIKEENFPLKINFSILKKTPTFFKDKIVLKIAWVSPRNDIPLKIVLNNVLGNSVFERSFRNSEVAPTITLTDENLSKLPSGIYFLSVYSHSKDLGRVKLVKP